MRETFRSQLHIGQVPIENIEFDLNSRDDIPQLLIGMQHLYVEIPIRQKVFSILEEIIPIDVDKKNGRPGMDLWQIFVLGCIRLDLNIDYDRLHDLANNHKSIRQMLGHGILDEDFEYNLYTIRRNVSLLTPEILDKINQVVVEAGHNLLKQDDEVITGRCDSFVVETDIHYPTDTNLLFDAVRKAISLLAVMCATHELPDWRQFKHNIKNIKNLLRRLEKLRQSNARDKNKKDAKAAQIIEAHHAYLNAVEKYVKKAAETIQKLRDDFGVKEDELADIERFLEHCYRQDDHIRRRVIDGETIPHDEKVFSVFEEYSEWISKGKAGVPVEFGLRVCVVEDKYGFMLHHRVMIRETDEKIAIAMVRGTQERYSDFRVCSFDKGFHSPANQTELNNLLDLSILPKKGKLSVADKEREHSHEFVSARRAHSAVESGINALEVHGLDRCPDHGLDGFKRYIALAIVGRNIQKLGAVILKRENEERERQRSRNKVG